MVISFLLSAATASAETLTTTWARTAPTIDGTIGYDEWAGARATVVTGALDYTFYVMSDEQHLYVAFDVTGDTTNGLNDAVQVYFDNNHDGLFPPDCATSDEGSYVAWAYGDLLFDKWSADGWCGHTTTTGAVFAQEFYDGHQHFELAADLAAGPLTGAPGETIGFAVKAWDSNENREAFWPPAANHIYPATWADLTFAEPPPEVDVPWANVPPKIDGIVEEGEWAGAVAVPGVSENKQLAFTAFLLADNHFLYGALETNDTGFGLFDAMELAFDNNLNGAWPADCNGDGAYLLGYDYETSELMRYFATIAGAGELCELVESTTFWALPSPGEDYAQIEFRIDLTGNEMYGAPEEQIGFYAAYADMWEWFETAQWPAAADPLDPATFGILHYPPETNSAFATGWAGSPPVIDGAIEAGEWADATEIPVAGTVEYIASFLSDGTHLYVAVDAIGDPNFQIYEEFVLAFDNNNDGAWPAECGDEGVLEVIWVPYLGLSCYFDPQSSGGGCPHGSPDNVEAAFGFVGDGHMQYETAVELNTGNIQGAPGETIGIMMSWVDVYDQHAIDFSVQHWPYYGGYWQFPPEHFAKMTYATCDGCDIDGVCYDDGEPNPDNECQWCDVDVSTTTWTNLDAVSCTDDTLWCNGDETCADGECAHEYSSGNPRCPDNALFCDGTESCDDNLDACVSSGDPCGAGTTCDEINDECDPLTDDDSADDDTADDDTTDDDTTDDDSADDDTTDDDSADDDTTDDDTADDDTIDDDTADDDSSDDDAVDDDTADDDNVLPQPDDDQDDNPAHRGDDDSGCGC